MTDDLSLPRQESNLREVGVSEWRLTFVINSLLGVSEPNKSEILLAPIVLVGIIGVILLSILIRRISTFNDCPEAAAELRKQIEQAREDLTSKGFKFD